MRKPADQVREHRGRRQLVAFTVFVTVLAAVVTPIQLQRFEPREHRGGGQLREMLVGNAQIAEVSQRRRIFAYTRERRRIALCARALWSNNAAEC